MLLADVYVVQDLPSASVDTGDQVLMGDRTRAWGRRPGVYPDNGQEAQRFEAGAS